MSNVSLGRVFKSFWVFKEMKFWDFGVPDPSLAKSRPTFSNSLMFLNIAVIPIPWKYSRDSRCLVMSLAVMQQVPETWKNTHNPTFCIPSNIEPKKNPYLEWISVAVPLKG